MRVLVVDDNLLSSTAILSQLNTPEYRPAYVRTSADALQAVQQTLPDLVLINLAARSFDPFALIRTLRASPTFAERRIVGFCGHLEHVHQKSAQEAGCTQVITNATAMRQLAAVLNPQ